MKLILNYEKTIREVKKELSQAFPLMTIEFVAAEASASLTKASLFPDTTELGDIRGVMKEGEIDLLSSTPAEVIEEVFRHQYFLPVHVYNRPAGR